MPIDLEMITEKGFERRMVVNRSTTVTCFLRDICEPDSTTIQKEMGNKCVCPLSFP
jgi:hypothetical protein